MRSIDLIAAEPKVTTSASVRREHYVLRRMLLDAMQQREFLLKLRTLALELERALEEAHRRGADPATAALAVLASLPWAADELRIRLASDFT